MDRSKTVSIIYYANLEENKYIRRKINLGETIKKIPSDLLIILVWITLTVLLIIIPTLKDNIIRTIFGIPTVLFIPGYTLINGLFPKKNDLDSIERIALSFGLSIAIVPLIGLGLNYTPFGIRLIPILISLTIFDISMIIIGTIRRNGCGEDQFTFPYWKIYDIFNEIKNEKKTDRILTIILIFSIIIAIGMVIYVITVPKVGEKFTEFYILNSTTEKADNYPTKLMGNNTALLVGVINHEYSIVNYTIQIDLDKNILSSQKLTLGNNETWEKSISIMTDKKGIDMKLEFLLFKENNFTAPYRELHLWVNAT